MFTLPLKVIRHGLFEIKLLCLDSEMKGLNNHLFENLTRLFLRELCCPSLLKPAWSLVAACSEKNEIANVNAD